MTSRLFTVCRYTYELAESHRRNRCRPRLLRPHLQEFCRRSTSSPPPGHRPPCNDATALFAAYAADLQQTARRRPTMRCIAEPRIAPARLTVAAVPTIFRHQLGQPTDVISISAPEQRSITAKKQRRNSEISATSLCSCPAMPPSLCTLFVLTLPEIKGCGAIAHPAPSHTAVPNSDLLSWAINFAASFG
jgi:hypothetical protein